MQPNSDSSLARKTHNDDIKTENRKSGCEPVKVSSTNVLEEDPIHIPIPSTSSRSNSSANKSSSNAPRTEPSGIKSNQEFTVSKDGIGGMCNFY